MYRRPYDLARVRYVACMAHRYLAAERAGRTEGQERGLSLGRGRPDNGLRGTVKSATTRARISAANKAFWAAHPEQALARGVRGDAHYQWKGGVSQFNQSVRRLHEYRLWARAVRTRDGQCTQCGSTKNLEAHHLSGLAVLLTEFNVTTRDQARAEPRLWDAENGITLCRKCHYAVHGRTHNAD